MKILFMSDSPDLPTGFGVVLDNLIKRFKDDYEIGLLPWQYWGRKKKENGITYYGCKQHKYANDTLHIALKDFKPDILFTLGDLWMVNYVANPGYAKLLERLKTKWIWYLPVDSHELPTHFINDLRRPWKVVTMSQFAIPLVKEIRNDVVHVPHGVDLEVFKRLPNRNEIRKEEKLDDKFVVGFVGRNQERKQPERLMEAFSIFSKDKDDTLLYLHCDPKDIMNTSKDFAGNIYPRLMLAMKKYGLGQKMVFSNNLIYSIGIPLDILVKIYNMFDVHALATLGEGFGLPIIESMACGVPNVMTDFTTCKELVYGRGEPVKVKTFMEGTQMIKRAIIDVDDMALKFEKLYQDRVLLKSYSDKCLKFVEDYDWSRKIIPQWKKLFEAM